MKTFTFLCALAMAALGLVGCGPSAEDQKEADAIKRIQNRQQPGSVRALNLGSDSVLLYDRGRQLAQAAETGLANRMMPVGTGKKKVTVGVGGTKTDIEVDFESNMGSTIIVGSNGKVLGVLNHEFRHPTDEANVNIFFVNADGSMATSGSATVRGPGGATTLKAGDKMVALQEGEWTGDGGASIKIEPKYAYSFVFIQTNGAFKPYLLLNTANDKPAAASASQ